MDIEAIASVWVLLGSVSISSEISFDGEEPDPNGVNDWLNGRASELVDKIEATSGLTLTIAADGNFSEVKEGEPKVQWFSDEGVLEAEVIPFNGVVKSNEHGFFLQPYEIPSWGKPTDEYGVIMRLDDGDTKICDRIELQGDKLVRTVNVVTDELYLDRIVIVYGKA